MAGNPHGKRREGQRAIALKARVLGTDIQAFDGLLFLLTTWNSDWREFFNIKCAFNKKNPALRRQKDLKTNLWDIWT
jgi:hypothetical protein